jgi:hypothetical protein
MGVDVVSETTMSLPKGDVAAFAANPDNAPAWYVNIRSTEWKAEPSGTVTAVALTSQPQRAGFPLTLELHAAGLPKPSWVKASQIRTLAFEPVGAGGGSESSSPGPVRATGTGL